MLFDQLQAESVAVYASCIDLGVVVCFLRSMSKTPLFICLCAKKSLAAQVAVSKQDKNKTPLYYEASLNLLYACS